jgi:tRNA(adenine34) deaminase
MTIKSGDPDFMQLAIEQAERAGEIGEVPVGAVVVQGGRVIAAGHNRREIDQDPTAHAEMIAIRQAAQKLGSWRLDGCTVYVTLEPCPMCAGAMILARVERVVFGTGDPKAGATGTLYRLHEDDRLNHTFEVVGGVLQDKCSALLSDFFKKLRKK